MFAEGRVRFCVLAISTFVCAALFVAPVTAEDKPGAATPLHEIEVTVDRVVRVAQDYKGDDRKKVRREKLREIIAPKFDFDEMAKRSLGAQWNECTPQEQADFVKVFSDLLARTYLERIETVEPNMVKMDKETVQFPKALVKTLVHHKGDTFPIDYKLLNTGGQWRVYDVIIENIGLVANYRSEFAGIIRKEKFAGLLKKLTEKNQKG